MAATSMVTLETPVVKDSTLSALSAGRRHLAACFVHGVLPLIAMATKIEVVVGGRGQGYAIVVPRLGVGGSDHACLKETDPGVPGRESVLPLEVTYGTPAA